ncbi:MAG TPA: thiamine-phosphate kinase [Myxococcaceae bacterium]|nr:thiamine-phosphate kinase [Myxococcaceae bacterium]
MGPEFQLIEAFVAAARASPRAPAGPGDDAALLARPRGETAVTVDAVVEDVHFRRPSSRLEDIGHKALAVNLSDLAAMGASPRWALVALGVRRGFSLREARALGAGFGALARKTGTALVGGNVTRAPGLSLTVTVGGEVTAGRALLRSGARPGDVVWVSGTLGDARLGLALLQRPAGPEARRLRQAPRLARTAVDRQRRPSARLELGAALVGLASSCIDLSDGLVQDAGHVARASRVAVHLALDAVPCSDALEVAVPDARERVRQAAAGGEDYELLFTARPGRSAAVLRLARRLRLPLTPIGEVRRGRGVHTRGAGPGGVGGFDHLA